MNALTVSHHSVPSKVTQVLIVGAGPTGLIAANMLGLAEIRTIVVERNSSTSDIPKGIYIDDEFFRTLDTVGLADEIAEHCVSAAGVTYFSRFGFCVTRVRGFITQNGYGNRSAIWQPELERILVRGARRFASVTVQFGENLLDLDDREAVVVAGILNDSGVRQEIRADYVLGCDGGKSLVRKLLGIPMEGRSYKQPWVVVDVLNDSDASPFSKYFINPKRPTDSIPAPFHGRRFEFMLLPGEDPETMLEDRSLRRLFAPFRDFDNLEICRRAVYTFHALCVRTMRKGRVFLLGDAAHLMPPFGASGMNSGHRDASNLCWKLAAVFQGVTSMATLDTYETERLTHTQATINISVLLGRIVNTRSAVLAFFRDLLFWVLSRVPPTRGYITEMKYIPRARIEEGLVVHDESRSTPTWVGRMIPQPEVQDSTGSTALLDSHLGYGFALIAVDCPALDLASTLRHDYWQVLGVKIIHVFSAVQRPLRDACLMLLDDRFREVVRQHTGEVLLVRPDRYVAAVTSPHDLDTLAQKIEHLLRLGGETPAL